MNSGKQCMNKMRSSTKVEITRMKQILELNMLDEMKNSVESFNSKLNQAEERICELEDRSLDIIQSWGEEKIRVKKVNVNYRTASVEIMFILWESEKEKGEQKGEKTHLKK